MSARMNETLPLCRGCTIPIYTVQDSDRVVLVGSGVLLDVDGLEYLVTAKHVTDQDHTGLYIPGRDSLIGLNATLHQPRLADGSLVDISIGLFQQQTTLNIHPEHSFARLGVDVSFLLPAYGQDCCVLGYPATRTNADNKARRITNTPLVIFTTIKATYQHAGSTMVGFDVVFRKQHKHAEKRFAPDPYGMSGGGVWVDFTNLEGQAGEKTPILLGVATEYIRHPDQVIRCVPISPFQSGFSFR